MFLTSGLDFIGFDLSGTYFNGVDKNNVLKVLRGRFRLGTSKSILV